MKQISIKKKFRINVSIFLFTILTIYLSPSVFNILEFDSPTYINNDPNRLSFYPFIIDILGGENFNFVITLQIILMSLSIFFLIKVLIKNQVSKYLIVIFFILTTLNYFYTSFSKTILTESFFFSFINLSISIILFFKDSKYKKILSFCFGFCIGLLIILRHEGIVISLALFLIFLFLKKDKHSLIVCLIPIIFLIFFENYKYEYDERKSVINRSFQGKVFMLSAFLNDEELDKFENTREYLIILREKSKMIYKFLEKVNNPFLKYSLVSDYEGVAQYQLYDILNKDEKEIINKTNVLESELLLKIIIINPFEFANLTFSHYLGLWMPAGKQLFLDKIKNRDEIPFFYQLKNSTGNLKPINKKLMLIGLIYFSLLMILFFFVTLEYLYNIIKRKKINFHYLVIPCHFHLMVISMFNIASTRYIMSVYPIIVMIIIFSLNKFLKNEEFIKK